MNHRRLPRHVPPSFNEAGAIMPRSGVVYMPLAEMAITRFNEAGAIMPRSGPRERLDELTVRFNEAGAIMPRSGSTARTGYPKSARLQ